MKAIAAIIMLGIALATAGAASASNFHGNDPCQSSDFATRFWCEASRNG